MIDSVGQRPPHYENFSCLPECDERHAEDCPREKAEKEYYRWYFAVGTPAFWDFAPPGRGKRDDGDTELL